jgi:hypothetical protein
MKFPAAETMKESSLVSYLLKIKQMILYKVSEGECSIIIPKNETHNFDLVKQLELSGYQVSTSYMNNEEFVYISWKQQNTVVNLELHCPSYVKTPYI